MIARPAATAAAAATLSLLLVACAKPRITADPIHFVAKTTADGRTRIDIATAKSTFEAAGEALSHKKHARALALYDRVVTQFAGSPYTLAALYNGGLACEKLGKWRLAARRY
ncbi:MAG: hypothetical protein KC503_03725, partial [Myxococcales bacterium]|nr:hypothetical protein [Myxococcales bacterium]